MLKYTEDLKSRLNAATCKADYIKLFDAGVKNGQVWREGPIHQPTALGIRFTQLAARRSFRSPQKHHPFKKR